MAPAIQTPHKAFSRKAAYVNPIKEIGRYQLPILNVIAIRARPMLAGWRKYVFFWRAPGFDVLLADGHRIHFTQEEKEIYDKEIETHETVLQFYGAARGAGLRG